MPRPINGGHLSNEVQGEQFATNGHLWPPSRPRNHFALEKEWLNIFIWLLKNVTWLVRVSSGGRCGILTSRIGNARLAAPLGRIWFGIGRLSQSRRWPAQPP